MLSDIIVMVNELLFLVVNASFTLLPDSKLMTSFYIFQPYGCRRVRTQGLEQKRQNKLV